MRQVTNWKNIFANHIASVCKIPFTTAVRKIERIHLVNGQKTSTNLSPKKIHSWQKAHTKMFKIVIREIKIKPQWNIIIYPLKRLRLKNSDNDKCY